MTNSYSRSVTESPVHKWKDRTPLIGTILGLIGAIFVARLFYIQIIKHETYRTAAVAEQLKKFSIPAERGTISVLSGDTDIPIVLNETRYLLYADPSFIKKPDDTAKKLQSLIGGDVKKLQAKLERKSRYEELARKLDEATKIKIAELKLPGIVTKRQRYRTYPEGQFAAQTLGFVNYDGVGQYGVEGYLDEELAGTLGQLKAITDVHGVPLAGNSDNIVKQPVDGDDITLSIDTTIQRIAEEAIKNGVERTQSPGGSVIVLESATGKVKAMANYPTYDPSVYEQVTDQNLYKNRSVSDAMEIGSIMKLMTISAALDLGAISKDGTYRDKGYEEADGYRIKNALSYGDRIFSIYDIIKYSLNTGAVHVLKEIGGGELNERTRILWHGYLTDHYRFGMQTGIEQSGEGKGIVPSPSEGYGLNIQYANTAFGQGISVTIMQFAAALGALVNGGTYFQPSLVYSTTGIDGVEKLQPPKVILNDVISDSASRDIINLMERYARDNNPEAARAGFSIGGKTGTAQIPASSGGYREDVFNGTYAGFVGGRDPQYVVVLRVDEARVSGFAGANAARPIFTEIANNMMNSLPLSRGL